jgi:hypothetical protein
MNEVSARFLLLIAMGVCVPVTAQTPAKKEIPPVVPIQSFNPARQKPVSYADARVQAALVTGQGASAVKIVDRSTKEEKLVALPVEMAQVNDMRRGGDNKLVVRGMVNGSGSEIAVIDLGSAKLVDKFVCYLPSMSRDGRYIAFVKFYPSHFAEGTDDHYMLYDIAKGAAENRPSGVPADDWKTVGKCVYPLGIANRDNDNIGVPKGSQHSSKSEFFWNPDREEFLFADQADTVATITLVLVDVAPSGEVTVKTIAGTTELCSASTSGAATCSALVRKAEFLSAPEAAVTVTFENVSNQQTRTVEYKSSQFQ